MNRDRIFNRQAFFNRMLHYICCSLLGFTILSCQPDEVPVKEDVRSQLLLQINELRKNGCTCGNEFLSPVKSLEWNTALEDAASSHASDMYKNNYFSHIALDGTAPITRSSSARRSTPRSARTSQSIPSIRAVCRRSCRAATPARRAAAA